MKWLARTPWTTERLSGLGLLAGLLFLLVCVIEPSWPAAVAVPPPVGEKAVARRSGDAHPTDLLFPVPSVLLSAMADSFADRRGDRVHHAVDIMAPRHSQVVAVEGGTIAKVLLSVGGGRTVYQWNSDKTFVYYYAHLENYAAGIEEEQEVRRGQVLGYVGTSGNAPPNTPHLHFAIASVTKKDRWWGGEPVDPYPIWR